MHFAGMRYDPSTTYLLVETYFSPDGLSSAVMLSRKTDDSDVDGSRTLEEEKLSDPFTTLESSLPPAVAWHSSFGSAEISRILMKLIDFTITLFGSK